MGSYKKLLNSLSDDRLLRQLSDNEMKALRERLLKAFCDLNACCEKHGLTVMLIGGSALGAVRHKGFIPWDDDLDVAMTRTDFEKLKVIFDEELGRKYILSAPNYKNNAYGRYPMMFIKDTLFVEVGMTPDSENAKVKIDIFIIDNIPDGIIQRYLKGVCCTLLMFFSSYEYSYEHDNEVLKQYMCKSKKGRIEYRKRKILGRFFAFIPFQKWANLTDCAFQYNDESHLMGIPSGRGHYFGEIRKKDTFIPPSKGVFEGINVNLPGNPHSYLTNLYGRDYMSLPPVEKRERHFIIDFKL